MSGLEAGSDQWLVRRVRQRDEGAFEILYGRYERLVYTTALRMVGGRGSEAEDVAQEAWLRCVQGLHRLKKGSAFGAWIVGITRNCGLERLRRERRSLMNEPDDGARPDSAAERVDLERAFEALAPGFRTVLLLHDLYGYTHGEIAVQLGIAPGTSNSQLSRARSRMRHLLNGSPTDD